MSTHSLLSPRQFVRDWLQLNAVQIHDNGCIHHPKWEEKDGLFQSLWLDYVEQFKAHFSVQSGKSRKPSPVRESDMKKALDEHVEEVCFHARKTTIKSLMCTTEDLFHVQNFVEAVTGSQEAHLVAVIAHTIWLIKRKMLKMPICDHIMPVFKSPQGSGKSTAINQLLGPVEKFKLCTSVDQIADHRYQMAFKNNYVVFTDEMQYASKADVDGLKNQITAQTNSIRRLGTNQIVPVPQNCTFIGATNRPLAEQIMDTTGMRRFYELQCLPKIDWTVVNSIDYQALWCGVDENCPTGYLKPHLQTISKQQVSNTACEDIDHFLKEYMVLPEVSGETKEVALKDIYQRYEDYCRSNGMKPLTSTWVGRKLTSRGLIGQEITHNKRKLTTYKINKESEIPAYDENQPLVFGLGKRYV